MQWTSPTKEVKNSFFLRKTSKYCKPNGKNVLLLLMVTYRVAPQRLSHELIPQLRSERLWQITWSTSYQRSTDYQITTLGYLVISAIWNWSVIFDTSCNLRSAIKTLPPTCTYLCFNKRHYNRDDCRTRLDSYKRVFLLSGLPIYSSVRVYRSHSVPAILIP